MHHTKLKLEPHLEPDELEERRRKAKDPVLRGHYQIVRLVGMGKTATDVMEATGYCRNWVREVARRYNEGGPEALGDRRHSNPGAKQRVLLDGEGRRELEDALTEPPADGGMWNSRKVAEWIGERSGRAVSRQRGWEYLRSPGHSPKVPRPRHKNVGRREQEAFKKGSR